MHPTPRWWSYFAAQRHQNCIKVRILSKYECKLALTDNKLFFNLQFIAEGQCTSKKKVKEINKNWSIKLWWKRHRMKNQEWRTFKYDLCVIVFFIWFSIVSWITMSHAYNIYFYTNVPAIAYSEFFCLVRSLWLVERFVFCNSKNNFGLLLKLAGGKNAISVSSFYQRPFLYAKHFTFFIPVQSFAEQLCLKSRIT